MANEKLLKLLEKETITPEELMAVSKEDLKLNSNDFFDPNPLVFAIENNKRPEIISAILELGADPTIVHVGYDNSALEIASMHSSNPEVVKLLVDSCKESTDFDDLILKALYLSAEMNSEFRIWEVLWLEQKREALTFLITEAISTAARKNEDPAWLDVFEYVNLPIDRNLGELGFVIDYDENHREYSYEDWGDGSPNSPLTIFMMAAEENPSLEIIKSVVSKAWKQNKFLPEETLILNSAISNENIEIMRFLVEKGYKTELESFETPYRESALVAAAYKARYPEIIHLLVKAGADIQERDIYGKTPLLLAAGSNPCVEVVRAFLEIAPNKNCRSNSGETALLAAAKSNPNPEVVKMLVEEGFDVRARDNEPSSRNSLEMALYFNHNPVVADVLIKFFPELLPPDQQKVSYPDYLLQRINDKALDKLLRDSEEDFYNLAFSKLISSDNFEVLKRLFAKIKDVDAMNWESLTPLMWAAMNCETTEKLELLVKLGAKPNKINKDQYTPLMKAAKFNDSLEIIKYLLKVGAKVSIYDKDNWSALHFAAQNNSNPKIVETLVQAGAKIDQKDNDGWTPLMIAAMENSEPKIIEALIDSGAKLNLKDSDGWDALHWAAKENKNPEVVKLLLFEDVKKNGFKKDIFISVLEAASENQNSTIHKELANILKPIIEKLPVNNCKVADLENYSHEIESLKFLIPF